MHPLLAERTTEQARLLDVIYAGRVKLGIPSYEVGVAGASDRPLWPTFQYVERTLQQEHGLVAIDVLATLPVIRGAGGVYGWVWHVEPSPVGLSDSSRVALTIAGMSHLAAAQEEVRLFLDTLAVMVANEQIFIAWPDEAQAVTIAQGTLRTILLAQPDTWDVGPRGFQSLSDLLAHEPATWHSIFSAGDDGVAVTLITLTRFLRGYGGITTAKEYVQRVIDAYTPPQPDPEPLHPSSLSLPEAIDYLNLVWRSHTGAPLVRIGRAEAAAKLVLDCATADEFESRVSALCSILAAVSVPETEGSKLSDLRTYLHGKLGSESSARAVEAVDDLRALVDIRVWRQHAGTDDRATRGMSRLGLSLPVYDWGSAWRHIQARTVAALSALREEIELLSV